MTSLVDVSKFPIQKGFQEKVTFKKETEVKKGWFGRKIKIEKLFLYKKNGQGQLEKVDSKGIRITRTFFERVFKRHCKISLILDKAESKLGPKGRPRCNKIFAQKVSSKSLAQFLNRLDPNQTTTFKILEKTQAKEIGDKVKICVKACLRNLVQSYAENLLIEKPMFVEHQVDELDEESERIDIQLLSLTNQIKTLKKNAHKTSLNETLKKLRPLYLRKQMLKMQSKEVEQARTSYAEHKQSPEGKTSLDKTNEYLLHKFGITKTESFEEASQKVSKVAKAIQVNWCDETKI